MTGVTSAGQLPTPRQQVAAGHTVTAGQANDALDLMMIEEDSNSPPVALPPNKVGISTADEVMSAYIPSPCYELPCATGSQSTTNLWCNTFC